MGMSKVAADVIVRVSYNMKDPSRTCVRTNANSEYLAEIMSSWVLDQMFSGRDDAKPADRDVYNVTIGLVIAGDVFYTESDTGNRALTCGIVLDVLAHLDSLDVKPLTGC